MIAGGAHSAGAGTCAPATALAARVAGRFLHGTAAQCDEAPKDKAWVTRVGHTPRRILKQRATALAAAEAAAAAPREWGTPPDPNDEHMLERARYAIFGTTPTSENPTGARTGNKIMKKALRGPKMMQYYGMFSDDYTPGGVGKMLKENRQILEEEKKRFRDHKGGDGWKLDNTYALIEGEWPPKKKYVPGGKAAGRKKKGGMGGMGGADFDDDGNSIELHEYDDWRNTRDADY